MPSFRVPPKVAVVIPFFQRNAGLLRNAVESIRAQSVLRFAGCTIHVAIVDDSSPVPAEQELDGLDSCPGLQITVRRIPNSGAGAARNAAISMLDADCEAVAFLDSDDVWTPDHLERALTALSAGADFYFCDARRDEQAHSRNAEAPEWFRQALLPVAGTRDLYWCTGPTDLAIVKGVVPTTSTIVHRHRHGSAGFPSRYFRFGEDQYYCLRFLAEHSRMVYSAAVEVYCGRGVNIFAGNTPGSESERLCLMDEIAYRKDALATLALSSPAAQHQRKKLAETQQAVLRQGLWVARAGRLDWLLRTIWARPMLLFHLPQALWSVLMARRQRHTPPAHGEIPPAKFDG